MVYSYVTYTKQDKYFNLVFENDMEAGKLLKVRFLPNTAEVFGKDKVDLTGIKYRDPEVILLMLEEYGITLITEGLQ